MSVKCKLEDLLWSKKLKMADVVKMTGISKTTIHAMYHDRVTKIDYGVIDRLCKALDCGISDLLEYLPDADETGKGVETNVTGV